MSVIKLLGRICDTNNFSSDSERDTKTFGLASDSLTQVAVVFAALVHDVQHSGAPNATLIKEQAPIAEQYKGKSVAEQHSIAVAWDLLMQDDYAKLRKAICGSTTTNDDLLHFRQVVKSAVLATDIASPELLNASNDRWQKTFGATQNEQDEHVAMDWKKAAVIDCLVQGSDVAHTMQHWQIYLKFTGKLFEEMFMAWKDGRTDCNPAENWVEHELGFFDNYVIPLAKKLQGCGVFGAAGAQYLEYAIENRKELALKGKSMVKELSERCEAEHMATALQNRDGVPAPTSLSFRISESSVISNDTAAEAAMMPDMSFRVSEQFGPGPGNLFLSKEWSLRDLSLGGPRPPKKKSALPSPYENVA